MGAAVGAGARTGAEVGRGSGAEGASAGERDKGVGSGIFSGGGA